MEQQQPDHPLRQWREAQRLTLDEAAAGVGTTRPVWWSWEKGGRIPSPQFMARLKEFTGGAVKADDFYAARGEAA